MTMTDDQVQALLDEMTREVICGELDKALAERIGRALLASRADAQAAVADIVRSVWGRCEALEDEAADKLANPEKLTDHEKGFWRGQKTVAKSIRRSTEMPNRAEGEKA